MRKTIYDKRYRSLVDALRLARLARGIRQKDVALELGVARSWVSKVEHAEIRVDALQLVRLADLYALDVHDLIELLQPGSDTRAFSSDSS